MTLDHDDIELVAEDDGVCIENANEHTRLKDDLEDGVRTNDREYDTFIDFTSFLSELKRSTGVVGSS